MPIKLNCSYCRKEFYKKESQIVRSKKHFCCKDHFYKYRRKYNYPPPSMGTKCHTKLKILAQNKQKKIDGKLFIRK